jgi:hypothetical protein
MIDPDNDDWFDEDEDAKELARAERWEPQDDEVEGLIDAVDFNED